MNKNKVIGLALVVVAAAPACFVASSGSGSAGYNLLTCVDNISRLCGGGFAIIAA